MRLLTDLALCCSSGTDPCGQREAHFQSHHEARTLGLPIALGREPGTADFHVNQLDGASSLLPSDESVAVLPLTDEATKTTEVRKVPVLLLEDVLERIPKRIDIEFVISITSRNRNFERHSQLKGVAAN